LYIMQCHINLRKLFWACHMVVQYSTVSKLEQTS